VNFHTKKPTIHITATPPATERPMMVDEETPELPPPELLPLDGGFEGTAEEEVCCESPETKTTLVTT
jgi:hypothetical protein